MYPGETVMRKIIIGLAALFLAFPAFSQVKIGNNPTSINKSSILELETDSLGLLLPRLQDTVLINKLNPPDGMLIIVKNPAPLRMFLRQSGVWVEVMNERSIRTYLNVGNGTLTDTSFLFYNLLRKADTAAMLSGYQRHGNPVVVPAQPNITSLGVLTGLTVTGNTTTGTLSTVTANVTNLTAGGNLTVTGNVTSNSLSTVTAWITNMISAGNVTVTGNISSGTLSTITANVTNLIASGHLTVTGKPVCELIERGFGKYHKYCSGREPDCVGEYYRQQL
jgi:hypothetical protein